MSKPYVITFEEIKSNYHAFPQKDYFVDYLNKHNCATAVIEYNYIDKDYIIDYSKFFARSHNHVSRRVVRIHFFSADFSQKDLENILCDLNEEQVHLNKLPSKLIKIMESYIGFIILKPILDDDGQKLIGRTLLKHPNPANELTQFIFKENKVNLFGIPLHVDSLPFQMQDTAVGGCATSALWIANSKLSELFGTPSLSPFEVTEAAVNHIEHNRNFPSHGLTIGQMLNFLKYIKLDYDIVDIRNLHSIVGKKEFSEKIIEDTKRDLQYLIPDTIRAYVNAEVPLICGIRLYKYEDVYIFNWNSFLKNSIEKLADFLKIKCGFEWNIDTTIEKFNDNMLIKILNKDNLITLELDDTDVIVKIDNIYCDKLKARKENSELKIYEKGVLLEEKPFHAVVISGYREDMSGNICELYVHDDQKGPYSSVTNASSDGSFLEWNCMWTEANEFDKAQVEILIIPTYPKMRTIYNKIYPCLIKRRREYINSNFDLKLYSIQKYKKDLITMDFDDKMNILRNSLPRFVWILSAYNLYKGAIEDEVYDATSHNVKFIKKIIFNDALNYSNVP